MANQDPQVEPRIPLELQAVILQSNRLGTIEEVPPEVEKKGGRLVFVRRWMKNKNHHDSAPKTPPETPQTLHPDSTDSRFEETKPTESAPQLKLRPATRRNISAPPVLQPPPSALKSKPRIPLELQAVFLESNRNGIVDRPAPKAASRIFGKRWTPKKKTTSFSTTESVSDGELDNPFSSAATCETKPRRRFLNFGANETFLFEKKKPTNARFSEATPRNSQAQQEHNRWNTGLNQKEASAATMPMRMPRRHSPRQ